MFEKVSGYPNYGVDEKGSVKNLKTGRILKTADKKGYKYVKLYNSSGCKTLFVHRIVAKTYLPNPSNWPEINHKDENPSNNCIENLEWCTSKYNANYGHHIEHCKNSLKKSDKSWLGRKHGEESKKKMSAARIGKPSTNKRAVIIDGEIEVPSLTECAKFLHISLTQTFNVINGTRKLMDYSIEYKEEKNVRAC